MGVNANVGMSQAECGG